MTGKTKEGNNPAALFRETAREWLQLPEAERQLYSERQGLVPTRSSLVCRKLAPVRTSPGLPPCAPG